MFLLHIPCCFIFLWGVSLTHPVLSWFYAGSFSYTSHAGCFLLSFFFVLHLGSFSYTSRAVFLIVWFYFFIRGVSLTHPCCFFNRLFLFFYQGSFSYTSRAVFLISLFLCFYQGSFSYTSRAWSIFIGGVSLTPPVQDLFLSGEFLLHIPCCLHCYAGSFTHPKLPSFLCGEFLLHIPYWLVFMRGVSLTHSELTYLFWCGEFLLHISCWLFLMWGASFRCSLLWRQSLKERAGWKLAQEKSVKKSLSNQRRKP